MEKSAAKPPQAGTQPHRRQQGDRPPSRGQRDTFRAGGPSSSPLRTGVWQPARAKAEWRTRAPGVKSLLCRSLAG